MIEEIRDILESYFGESTLCRMAAIEINNLSKRRACGIREAKGDFKLGDAVKNTKTGEVGSVAEGESGKWGFLFKSGWLPITTKGIELF